MQLAWNGLMAQHAVRLDRGSRLGCPWETTALGCLFGVVFPCNAIVNRFGFRVSWKSVNHQRLEHDAT